MDPVAVWTALGVLATLLVAMTTAGASILASDAARSRRRIAELERQLTDYLIRLTESEHKRREVEQLLANFRANSEMQYHGKLGAGRPHENPDR